MVAVSVVVVAKDFRSSLGGLVQSLDLQTLPTTQFDVVVVDLGSTDQTLERLREVATHRPNITLIEHPVDPVDADPEWVAAVDPAVWLAAGHGEYVLRLRPEQHLFPEALERLYAEAKEKDCDAVAARVSQQHAGLLPLFLEDRAEVDSTLLPESLASAAVLVRRSLLETAAQPGSDGLPAATRVAVLASYPVLRQPAEVVPEAGALGVLRQDQPSVSWVDGRLRVSVGGRVSTGDSLEADLSEARPVAVVRHADTGLSYVVPGGDGSVAGFGAEWGWDLAVDIDVLTAASGAPLGSGRWEVDVHLVGGQGAAPVPTTLSWAYCGPAILDTTIVVPSPAAGATFQLDVGPTAWPLVRGVDPSEGTVTESAAGSRLVLRLPHVHVLGSARIPGQIALDSLRLRAEIVTDGYAAQLEGFVSGLFGSPHLSTAFGEASMQPTGLGFDISGLGGFTVTKAKPKPKAPAAKSAPAPAKKAPAKKAPAPKTAAAGDGGSAAASTQTSAAGAKRTPGKKAPGKKAPGKKATGTKAPVAPPSTIQKARRALPKALDPVIDRIAAQPVARELYRRTIKK
jgi:hypothetical protein